MMIPVSSGSVPHCQILYCLRGQSRIVKYCMDKPTWLLQSPRMARKLRVEYARAIYHVMSRGDRREAIFHDDQDRLRFLQTLGEACGTAEHCEHGKGMPAWHFQSAR